MQLSDLNLVQSIVEVRFANAYSLWDKAGQLATNVSTHFDDLQMVIAEPNRTTFRSGDNLEFSTALDRASLSAFKPPRTLAKFSEQAHQFFPTVAKTLDISEYTRVGCRLIFSKEYPSVRDASDALLSTKILRLPGDIAPFNHSGPPIRPEWALSWENERTGVNVRLRIDERKYDFKTPLEWEGPQPDKSIHILLMYDVDVFTRAPVLVTQMSFLDWIKQCVHLTNRDSDRFLGGVK